MFCAVRRDGLHAGEVAGHESPLLLLLRAEQDAVPLVLTHDVSQDRVGRRRGVAVLIHWVHVDLDVALVTEVVARGRHHSGELIVEAHARHISRQALLRQLLSPLGADQVHWGTPVVEDGLDLRAYPRIHADIGFEVLAGWRRILAHRRFDHAHGLGDESDHEHIRVRTLRVDLLHHGHSRIVHAGFVHRHGIKQSVDIERSRHWWGHLLDHCLGCWRWTASIGLGPRVLTLGAVPNLIFALGMAVIPAGVALDVVVGLAVKASHTACFVGRLLAAVAALAATAFALAATAFALAATAFALATFALGSAIHPSCPSRLLLLFLRLILLLLRVLGHVEA